MYSQKRVHRPARGIIASGREILVVAEVEATAGVVDKGETATCSWEVGWA